MHLIEHDVQPLRSLDAVRLGRFIVSKEEPQQGFIDPDCEHPYSHIINRQEDWQETTQELSSASSHVDAPFVAEFDKSHSARGNHSITTSEVIIYQLNNSDHWFESALQDEKLRRWIETARQSTGKIYLIVGYKTVRHAAMMQAGSQTSDMGGTARARMTEGNAIAARIPPLSGFVDPNFRAHKATQSDSQQHFTAPGEQVAQIQLRKLKFGFLSSRNIDKAKLDGRSQWRCTSNVRGLASDVDDIISVRLEEENETESESEDEEL